MYLAEPEDYAAFPEPDEDELDMLDLAAGLKDGCSRLACQLRVKDYKRGEALEIVVPKESNNLFE